MMAESPQGQWFERIAHWIESSHDLKFGTVREASRLLGYPTKEYIGEYSPSQQQKIRELISKATWAMATDLVRKGCRPDYEPNMGEIASSLKLAKEREGPEIH